MIGHGDCLKVWVESIVVLKVSWPAERRFCVFKAMPIDIWAIY